MKEKCCYIIKNHDYLDYFIIPYILLSILIAIFLGLFWFFIWIMIHFILEIYKRYLIFNKIDLDDILIALQHCEIDLFFFFIAWNIESITHIKGAVSLSPLRGIARLEKILSVFEVLARVVGFAKTSKGIYQIIKKIISKEKFLDEEVKFKPKKKDFLLLGFIIISFIITILFHIYSGLCLYEIIEIYIETLF